MHATPTPKSIGQGTWVVVRLIVCGCGGLYVMLFNSVAFIARVFGNDSQLISPFLSLPLAFLGAVMMLYGVGEWGHWAYLWIFLSIPISLFLLLVIPGGDSDKGLPVVVAAVATYAGVRAHYARGVRAKRHENDIAV
jgi:hypothetical protein